MREANIKAGTETAGVSRSVDYYGNGAYGVNYRHRAANPEFAQAKSRARQTGMNKHLEALQEIDQMTLEIRRKMTERYNVEF